MELYTIGEMYALFSLFLLKPLIMSRLKTIHTNGKIRVRPDVSQVNKKSQSNNINKYT